MTPNLSISGWGRVQTHNVNVSKPAMETNEFQQTESDERRGTHSGQTWKRYQTSFREMIHQIQYGTVTF